MKVKVSVTVDVDVEAWMREYGLMRGDVRADVIEVVHQTVHEHLASLGLLTER